MLPALLAATAFAPLPASAGAQVEEQLAPSVVVGLAQARSPTSPCRATTPTGPTLPPWVAEMSPRIGDRSAERGANGATSSPPCTTRRRVRVSSPQLVLGVIYHESGFKKFAISSADARGYMQVMPFWIKLIGSPDQNLFNLRTNLRYGSGDPSLLPRRSRERRPVPRARALQRQPRAQPNIRVPCWPRSTASITRRPTTTAANVVGTRTSLPQ